MPLAAQDSLSCPTGKEGNTWYFGAYSRGPAGLDFNGGDPVYLDDAGMPNNSCYEAYSTVSDADGQLLFYTNGETVWNRSHQTMAGVGFGIGGDPSATQVLALPWPGHPGRYYIFTPQAIGQNAVDSVQDIFFSTLDMAPRRRHRRRGGQKSAAPPQEH